MSDYIDRQAAIWACRGYIYHDEDANAVIDAADCAKALENVPAADVVEVRHGRWEIIDGRVSCSECGEPNMEWNYCPNCGADMRGRER